ncbi:uncharacterized protein HKW66_Vig0170690 [Vigna angularis]|uniref:Uncharacterized protein n=1 Tax=Phaseolus angularis TaxID=3914 RepID=A0A8T0JQX4_PHAAN|nr:vegetative cell wall protein gp1-like [Vigna angularis]KAG2380290.1 uncharacterized protein HKW66_Vig0170690 [Vigna angularis]
MQKLRSRDEDGLKLKRFRSNFFLFAHGFLCYSPNKSIFDHHHLPHEGCQHPPSLTSSAPPPPSPPSSLPSLTSSAPPPSMNPPSSGGSPLVTDLPSAPPCAQICSPALHVPRSALRPSMCPDLPSVTSLHHRCVLVAVAFSSPRPRRRCVLVAVSSLPPHPRRCVLAAAASTVGAASPRPPSSHIAHRKRRISRGEEEAEKRRGVLGK